MLAALSVATLVLNARFEWRGLAGLVVRLFLYGSVAGLIVANSSAGSLPAFPHKAGAASAPVGATHNGIDVLSTALIGWFADGTPWTMGWIVGLGGVGIFVTAQLLVRS